MSLTEYNHVLYYSTFSVCSVMVRLSYVLRGSPKDVKDEITLKEEHIDIAKKEQLTEHFLCEVNGFGEVPVLVPIDGKPVPDSLEITLYLAKFYPALLPGKHSAEIKRLLGELHKVNFFSVSFPGQPRSPIDTISALEARLGEDVSERYRQAMQVKIKRVQKEKLNAVTDDEVDSNVKQSVAVLRELEVILQDSPTRWCFGLEQPSALDTHLLVFIVRLQDAAQDRLIPDALKSWAENFMQMDEWTNLMQGKRTLPPPLLAAARARNAAS